MSEDKIIYSKMVVASLLSDSKKTNKKFDHALVNVTESLAKRIVELRDAVETVGADRIEEFNPAPSFYLGEINPKLVLEKHAPNAAVMKTHANIVVDRDFYHWEGYVTEGHVEWETSFLTVETLEALLIPSEDLLKHVGREWSYEEADRAFKDRLSKE